MRHNYLRLDKSPVLLRALGPVNFLLIKDFGTNRQSLCGWIRKYLVEDGVLRVSNHARFSAGTVTHLIRLCRHYLIRTASRYRRNYRSWMKLLLFCRRHGNGSKRLWLLWSVFLVWVVQKLKVLGVVDTRDLLLTLLAMWARVLHESRLSSTQQFIGCAAAVGFHLVVSVESVDGYYWRSSATKFCPSLNIWRWKNAVNQRHCVVLWLEVEWSFDDITVHDFRVPLHFHLSNMIEIISI